jgi:hypothetical protein
VGSKLEVLHRFLVNVRTADNAEPSNIGGQGNRSGNASARSASGLGDFLGGLIDHAMIVGP